MQDIDWVQMVGQRGVVQHSGVGRPVPRNPQCSFTKRTGLSDLQNRANEL